jgi:hypothetical protein
MTTTPPDIAPTLARVLKHEDCCDLLYLLQECGPQVAVHLEIGSRRPTTTVGMALSQLVVFGLVSRQWSDRSYVYSLIDRHADAIREALTTYQQTGRFSWVLRDPPKPKSRRGIALVGMCS